jgi:hypothetical protein
MEPVLLSVDAAQFIAVHKAAATGDQEAIQAIEALWDAYKGQEIPCFFCDEIVQRPVFTHVLPEYGTNQTLIGAPLCEKCRSLPQGVRWSRGLKILQRMFSARSGKNIRFHFNQCYRHPHPR